jgi:diguanylate cyclase
MDDTTLSNCIQRLKPDEALALGHETIDLMHTHRVLPTAQNYEVWLSYRLNALSDLRREIDERLALGLPFNEDFCSKLHERFFVNARLTVQMAETGEQIAQELSTVLTAMAAAGDHAKEYAGDLEMAARTLNQRISADQLRQVVASMASATVKMLNQNKNLSEQLTRSGRQLDTMRKTLKQARAEAMTDGLTGLANRRLFDETLRGKMRDFSAAFGPLTLGLLDIDHFKRFNDTWGHQTGDQIIRFVAATLLRHVPQGGLPARYGGEEFAVLLPGANLEEARKLLEAIRVAIESKTLMRKSTGEDLGRITISSGLSLLRKDDTPASLIERADACLYSSKRNGRNRVTLETQLLDLSAA